MSTSVLIHPLGPLGFTRVTGRDTRDYLNRRLCQKVLDIPDGHGRRAFLLDAIGKIQLDLEVYALDGELLLLAPANGREAVIPQLERYVFTEDCTFEDRTEAYRGFAILGPQRNELLASIGFQNPDAHQVMETASVFIFGSDYALGDALLMVPAEKIDEWKRRIDEAVKPLQGVFIGSDEFEATRIANGRPAWLVDITGDDMPLDAPSVRHGVHFDKGCFPGQEALARVENLGHPAKCLIQLQSSSRDAPEDSKLHDATSGEEMGRITSVGYRQAEHRLLALAMVKWSAREAGRRFVCGKVEFESLGPVPATEALGR